MFVIGAKRTAFGKFGGILKDKTATDLAEIAARAALQEAAIKPENVDHVVFGWFFSKFFENFVLIFEIKVYYLFTNIN